MATRDELRLCGLPAVRARFQQAPESILRLYFDAATGRKLGVMCKALAASRRVYRTVETVELEKIAGSVHHGGVVAVVDAPRLKEPKSADFRRWATQRAPVVVLDRIGNAHNLGAIARSAAYFGVEHLIVPAHPAAAVPNDAAYRIAEGGLEQLTVWRTSDLVGALRGLQEVGYDVVGAATRGGQPTAPAQGRVALVMGNEEQGMAPEVAAACTRLVTLRGSGRVESLNVSVAAGVLLHALLQR